MNGGSGISIGGVRILRVITKTAISIKTILNLMMFAMYKMDL